MKFFFPSFVCSPPPLRARRCLHSTNCPNPHAQERTASSSRPSDSLHMCANPVGNDHETIRPLIWRSERDPGSAAGAKAGEVIVLWMWRLSRSQSLGYGGFFPSHTPSRYLSPRAPAYYAFGFRHQPSTVYTPAPARRLAPRTSYRFATSPQLSRVFVHCNYTNYIS